MTSPVVPSLIEPGNALPITSSPVTQAVAGSSQTVVLTAKNAAGVPTDVDGGLGALPSLTVTREDGATYPPPLVTHTGTGVYSTTLAPSQLVGSLVTAGPTSTVDQLTVTWTAVVGGTATTVTQRLDVVGGLYFDLGELRALPNMSDPPPGNTTGLKYPDVQLIAARMWIEALIERVCDTSFVQRYARQVFDGNHTDPLGTLSLREPYARSILSVRLNGVFMTPTELAGLAVFESGKLERYATGYAVQSGDYSPFSNGSGYGYNISPWPRGRRNIEVRYAAAFADLPADDLRQAALQAARYRVLSVYGSSGTPDRALSVSGEYGVFSLASANVKDRPTGLPEVDATILGWRDHVRIPGLA